LSHEILDVSLSAYRGPQDFNSLYRKRLKGKIIRHVLKGRVSLKKMLVPFVQVTLGDRALCQEFRLTHVKIQVAVFEFGWSVPKNFKVKESRPIVVSSSA